MNKNDLDNNYKEEEENYFEQPDYNDNEGKNNHNNYNYLKNDEL